LTRFNGFSTRLPEFCRRPFDAARSSTASTVPMHFSLGNDAVNVRGVSQAPDADSSRISALGPARYDGQVGGRGRPSAKVMRRQ